MAIDMDRASYASFFLPNALVGRKSQEIAKKNQILDKKCEESRPRKGTFSPADLGYFQIGDDNQLKNLRICAACKGEKLKGMADL